MPTPTLVNSGPGPVLAAVLDVLRDATITGPFATALGVPAPAVVEVVDAATDLGQPPQQYPALRVSFEDGDTGTRLIGSGPARRNVHALSVRAYYHADDAPGPTSDTPGYLAVMAVLRVAEAAILSGLRGRAFVYAIRPGSGSNRVSRPVPGYPAIFTAESRLDVYARAADGYA